MNMLFRIICCLLLILASETTNAQNRGCLNRAALADGYQALPDPFIFDPQVLYRQPVVLISFSDTEFSTDAPAAFYNRVFNEKGFNMGVGPGCVADYICEQSDGRANIQFDIYGPIQVSHKAGGHGSIYYGGTVISEAVKKLRETEETDFAIYDWDGDGQVNQVVFVAAGPSGNFSSGYIWPNTGYAFSTLPGGIKSHINSISCELAPDGTVYGFGTIVHEYLHALGLPDIYPLAPAVSFSTVDEWDIMDGGNSTNYGWCPPNLSAMERMYLGWASPTELTESTSIQDMRPVSDGGETFIIRSPGNSDEFYLLENRQQEGWDYGCPGNGLLIFHVDYAQAKWCDNKVNTDEEHFRYSLFHADDKDYIDWDPYNDGKDNDKWTMDNHLRSRYLSTSPYPYTDPTTNVVNDGLTDTSQPASVIFSTNAEGENLMSKAITDIKLSADGTISFNFMKSVVTGVDDLVTTQKSTVAGWYDLNGHRLSAPPHHPGVYIVLYNDGTKKCRRYK